MSRGEGNLQTTLTGKDVHIHEVLSLWPVLELLLEVICILVGGREGEREESRRRSRKEKEGDQRGYIGKCLHNMHTNEHQYSYVRHKLWHNCVSAQCYAIAQVHINGDLVQGLAPGSMLESPPLSQ